MKSKLLFTLVKTIVQLVCTIVNWTRDHGVFGIRLIHEKKDYRSILSILIIVLRKKHTMSIQNICEMSTSMLPSCLPGQESGRTVEFISLKLNRNIVAGVVNNRGYIRTYWCECVWDLAPFFIIVYWYAVLLRVEEKNKINRGVIIDAASLNEIWMQKLCLNCYIGNLSH